MHRKKLSFQLSVCLLAWMLGGAVSADVVVDLGRGPVTIFTPASYDSTSPTPLILLLHGYTATGSLVESWMQFLPVIDTYGFLYAHPDGTTDTGGSPFWNATDACCNFWNSPVDDAGYLAALIDTVAARFNLDPGRVYIAGHSNGGFMAYRMACDYSEKVAAVMSFAGATWYDNIDCSSTSPVHVVQIHGTSDPTIHYNGGQINSVPYPGAFESISRWGDYNGCAAQPDTLFNQLDIVPGQGNETDIIRIATGCSPGGSAELWKIPGAGHTPALSPGFAAQVVEFFYAHPKPGVSTSMAVSGESAASNLFLSCFPNPFRRTSTLRFTIPRPANVDLEIFDVRGSLTRVLAHGSQFQAGSRTVEWYGVDDRGRRAPPGVYFVRLRTGDHTETRKITLVQ